MIKGVIFDFNGTLVNDKKANEAAWYKALMKLSNGQVNFDEFYPRYTSVKDTILIAAMFDEIKMPYDKEKLDEYAEFKEEEYRKTILEMGVTKLRAGAEDVFRYLKKNGIPFNMATSSIKNNVDFYFATYGLDAYFDRNLVVYDDGNYTDKVRMYKDAAKRIGVPIEKCIVFEDSMKSLQEAVQAGCKKVVAVAMDNHPEIIEIRQQISDYQELDYSIFEE